MEIRKRNDPELFTRVGFMLQLIAAGWHHKSPAQLKQLGDTVGRERIMVVHGTADRMISFPHGEKLLEYLGGEESGVRKMFVEDQSHVMPIELRKKFHGWIADMVDKGESLNKQ